MSLKPFLEAVGRQANLEDVQNHLLAMREEFSDPDLKNRMNDLAIAVRRARLYIQGLPAPSNALEHSLRNIAGEKVL